MNTPVSFEIAKLLKEKGFDKRVKGFYDIEKELHINYVDEMNTKGFANRHLPKGECSAPTITEVVMWLYEKHRIWTVVNVNIMGSWYFEHFDLKEKRNAEFKPTDTQYDSPTEAYEAAILYTLNNLI